MIDLSVLHNLFLTCSGVTTDSRECGAGLLFFALTGDTFDGNAFAAKALEAGCKYAVIDDESFLVANDGRYILVDDALDTLQQLANYHRRTLRTPIIAITGTNGKTTTKELIAAVLSEKYKLLSTRGNLNNHIGVPLTLLGLNETHEMAVIEMGASLRGEIKMLTGIVEPDYGLITNIGMAHLLGFGSLDTIIRTKGELFDYLRGKQGSTVFVHHDNPLLTEMAHGLRPVYYGTEKTLFVSGTVAAGSPYLSFEWRAGDTESRNPVHTQLIGKYNLPNALAAIAVGMYFGVPADRINRAIESYTPQNNRSQLKKTASNTLIIDAYNANPTSMAAALENFRQMEAESKTLILGDMLELGAESDAEHQRIVDYLAENGFREVHLVGEQFARTVHPYNSYKDVEELIGFLKASPVAGRTILIKGSNGIKLPRAVEWL